MAEENNLSIYLLGGFKDTAEKTGYQLSAVNKQLHIAGWSNKNPDDPSIAEDVNRANPDILFVAYGPTIQEKWISENLKNIDTKLAIGVGGSFDYIAGTKSAPPKIIRYSGLEWLWRLLTQPKRFKRIMNATFGLMCELWHYKVFESLPLRPNVAVVILNSQKQVLVCQRRPSENKVDIIVNKETLGGPNYWQLPQGGVDGKEDFSETAKREAFEETGLKNLSLIKISSKTHTYIWNNSLRNFWSNKNKRNKGQTQHVVYLNFNGQNSDVKVDNREFINYKWVDINELENTIHPERYGLTKIVADDLAEPTF
jgi:exopolysaccharide biosynthesis WecB/TagA/CpsF family protein